MSPSMPQAFGRYVLTQLIGEGGMAEVYLATVRVAQGLTKRVVIKKIRRAFANQSEFTRMFVDEAKIALSLNHANIVQVFDFGQVQGAFYLAMEVLEGVDLMRLFQTVAKRKGVFPPVIAAYIAHQVAAALAYAHRKSDEHGRPLGIVHRDISPHNIMVSYEGQVKILDFGIARTSAPNVDTPSVDTPSVDTPSVDPPNSVVETAEETIKGKVAYMSPEQASGRSVDQRSDVYSLGIVLYELITGTLQYRSKDRLNALERVRSEGLPPLAQAAPGVPTPLCAIVDRSLARIADDRYDTAREVQSDLAEFLHRADPVVDDEVLSRFVAQFHHPDPPSMVQADPGQPSVRANRAPGSVQRVVVVHVAIDPKPLMPGDPQIDPAPFVSLAADIAFKRDALVLQRDSASVVLVFGTLLQAPDDPDKALRAALALHEDVAEMCPGLRVGIVVARVPATLRRDDLGNLQVELRGAIPVLLRQIAHQNLDREVVVTSNLVEQLSRAWRFGQDRFIAPSHETLSGIDRDLENVAPVLGPALVAQRREPQAPGGRSLLFGRELELKALREGFSEAIRARESRAVLVVGDPGIGKRALVERFVASLPRTACWVLRATGSHARRNVALGVFLDLLANFLGLDHTSDEPQIVRKLETHGVSDARNIGAGLACALGLPSTLSGLDPFAQRDRIWKLVRRLSTALAQRRPVLLVIENIHLLDEQSLLLLKEWMHAQHPWPILVLTTGRPNDQRVTSIGSSDSVAEIRLDELDHTSRRELISQRFEDGEGVAALADAILARTGGNPLFIEQVLATLVDRGVVAWNSSGRALVVRQRGANIEVPPSVEAALANRIEQLARGDREVLQGASVLGRQFRVAELAALLGRSVGKSLETLVDRHFLERLAPISEFAESIRFTTVSLHEVCRASLPRDVASAAHARAAALLRSRPDYTCQRDDGAIADHLVAAGKSSEAIDPALGAASRAYDRGRNVEAYYHLSQALSAMPEHDARRWDPLLRRERILRAWGRRRAQAADIRELLHTTAVSHDPSKQAIASIRLLRFYLEVERIGQAQRLLPRVEDEIAVLDNAAPYLAVLGELRSELMFVQGKFQNAEDIAREALVHCAADTRGKRQRCRLLRSIGQVRNSVGAFADARKYYNEALAIARGISNLRLEANLLNALGEVAGRSTLYQEAINHFKAALQIDKSLGDRYATGRKLANLGMTYACIGLRRRAERFLRKALELHDAVGHPGEFNDVAVHLGELVADSGDLPGAHSLLEEAARVAAARGDFRTELRARVRLAAALVRNDAVPQELETARRTAASVLASAQSHGLRTSTCRALHVLARVAYLRNDLDGAIERLTAGVALVRAGAAPLDGVRSIHLLGRLLREDSQREPATAYLQEAATIVKARYDDLRDPQLRASYLQQADARTILADGGIDPEALESETP